MGAILPPDSVLSGNTWISKRKLSLNIDNDSRNQGPTLARDGPGSMLLGYAIVGVLRYSVVIAAGDTATWLSPLHRAQCPFHSLSHRFRGVPVYALGLSPALSAIAYISPFR